MTTPVHDALTALCFQPGRDGPTRRSCLIKCVIASNSILTRHKHGMIERQEYLVFYLSEVDFPYLIQPAGTPLPKLCLPHDCIRLNEVVMSLWCELTLSGKKIN